MDTPILIFGSQAKARIALEILQCNDIIVYGMLDAHSAPAESITYSHVPVLGHIKDPAYLTLLGEKCHAFIAIEDIQASQALIAQLGQENKLHPASAIHPSVQLAKESYIGAGNIIHTGSSIGPQATVHNHCTLMGHNMIAHDATLHDFVHLGPGAMVNTQATLHTQVRVGSGAIIQENVTVGAQAYIAPGTVVHEDVPAETMVAGNPARVIKHIDHHPKDHG